MTIAIIITITTIAFILSECENERESVQECVMRG